MDVLLVARAVVFVAGSGRRALRRLQLMAIRSTTELDRSEGSTGHRGCSEANLDVEALGVSSWGLLGGGVGQCGGKGCVGAEVLDCSRIGSEEAQRCGGSLRSGGGSGEQSGS